MSIRVQCSQCEATYSVADSLSGKKIRCKKCQEVIPVPNIEDENPADDAIEDEPATVKKGIQAKGARSRRAPSGDGEEEDRARGKSGKSKRSKAKAEKSSSNMPLVLGAVGLLVLVIGGVVTAVIKMTSGSDPKTAAKGSELAKKDQKTTPEKSKVIDARVTFAPELGKEGDARKIGMVLLSRDGKRLAVRNGKGQLWDISAEPKKLHEFDGPILGLSPDGQRLVVIKKNSSLLVDADSAADIGRINGFGCFHANNVWGIRPFEDAQRRWKAAFERYDAGGKKDKELEVDYGGRFGDRFSALPEKGEVFFVSRTTGVHVWDVSSEKWARKIALKLPPGLTLFLETSYAVSPDGKWLLAYSGIDTFDPVIFDLSSGAPTVVLPFFGSTGAATKIPITQIPSQAFFPNNPAFVPNRDILMGSRSKGPKNYHVAAFDIKSKAVVGIFGTVESDITTLAVSADGCTLAAGTREGQVAIWDLNVLK